MYPYNELLVGGSHQAGKNIVEICSLYKDTGVDQDIATAKILCPPNKNGAPALQ